MSSTLPVIVVAAAAVSAAAIDIQTRRVPNPLTAAIALVGVGIAAAGLGRVGVGLSLAGCLVGLVLMLPGYVIGAMGGGSDVQRRVALIEVVVDLVDVVVAGILTGCAGARVHGG